MLPLFNLFKLNTDQGPTHSTYVNIQRVYMKNIYLFCTGLCMIRSLFGENIICQMTERGISLLYAETTCFINGTMTIGESTTLYHNYYQWVPIYLLLLAIGCHLPYSIWSKQYGTYLKEIQKYADQPDKALYLIKLSSSNKLFYKTWLLEIVYAAYLCLTIFGTNMFFNNIWSQSGWSLPDAIYKIFPDKGTCYITYDHGGGSTEGKFNCLLPLSNVYRKIFSMLYGIYCILLIYTVGVMIYRIWLIYKKRCFVNTWWLMKITEWSTTSWVAQQQMNKYSKKVIPKDEKDPFPPFPLSKQWDTELEAESQNVELMDITTQDYPRNS